MKILPPYTDWRNLTALWSGHRKKFVPFTVIQITNNFAKSRIYGEMKIKRFDPISDAGFRYKCDKCESLEHKIKHAWHVHCSTIVNCQKIQLALDSCASDTVSLQIYMCWCVGHKENTRTMIAHSRAFNVLSLSPWFDLPKWNKLSAKQINT